MQPTATTATTTATVTALQAAFLCFSFRFALVIALVLLTQKEKKTLLCVCRTVRSWRHVSVLVFFSFIFVACFSARCSKLRFYTFYTFVFSSMSIFGTVVVLYPRVQRFAFGFCVYKFFFIIIIILYCFRLWIRNTYIFRAFWHFNIIKINAMHIRLFCRSFG